LKKRNKKYSPFVRTFTVRRIFHMERRRKGKEGGGRGEGEGVR
jgi:hypothetical protein